MSNGVSYSILTPFFEIEKRTTDIGIHQYQAGVLYTYENYERLIKNGTIKFFSNGDFSVKDDYYCTKPKSLGEMEKILRYMNCLALFNIPELKPVSRIEVCYNLEDVFNKEKYSNSKKFYKLVKRGLNIHTREGNVVRFLDVSDTNQASRLHDSWVKYKLENYNLFKILFPTERYKKCLKASLEKEMAGKILSIGCFTSQGKMLGYRTIYKRGTAAYDLAYITDRNITESDFSEHFEIVTLNFLKDNCGIQTFNCGLSEGKLKDFKKHLPNKEKIYYRYKKR